jgi:hypothetical protein
LTSPQAACAGEPPDSVPQRVSAMERAGSVGARSLRCHANGFTARPIIPSGGGLLIIAIGIAWPFILAVCVGIEESAVARLLDHCLGQHRRCGQARQNRHHSKEPGARHWVSPLWDMAPWRITPGRVCSSRYRPSLNREGVSAAVLPAIYWRASYRATGKPDRPSAAGLAFAGADRQAHLQPQIRDAPAAFPDSGKGPTLTEAFGLAGRQPSMGVGGGRLDGDRPSSEAAAACHFSGPWRCGSLGCRVGSRLPARRRAAGGAV